MKMKYEPPMAIDLSGSGSGGECKAGSVPSENCDSGMTAGVSCGMGSFAAGSCAGGMEPNVLCVMGTNPNNPVCKTGSQVKS